MLRAQQRRKEGSFLKMVEKTRKINHVAEDREIASIETGNYCLSNPCRHILTITYKNGKQTKEELDAISIAAKYWDLIEEKDKDHFKEVKSLIYPHRQRYLNELKEHKKEESYNTRYSIYYQPQKKKELSQNSPSCVIS